MFDMRYEMSEAWSPKPEAGRKFENLKMSKLINVKVSKCANG